MEGRRGRGHVPCVLGPWTLRAARCGGSEARCPRTLPLRCRNRPGHRAQDLLGVPRRAIPRGAHVRAHDLVLRGVDARRGRRFRPPGGRRGASPRAPAPRGARRARSRPRRRDPDRRRERVAARGRRRGGVARRVRGRPGRGGPRRVLRRRHGPVGRAPDPLRRRQGGPPARAPRRRPHAVCGVRRQRVRRGDARERARRGGGTAQASPPRPGRVRPPGSSSSARADCLRRRALVEREARRPFVVRP